MKKVLSVAMASAMVLGMGANAFAIQYSSGSSDTAAWPSGFQFDGSLFVTDEDGNIVKSTITDLNGKTRVDFMPGDTIWMPLYANNQKVYTVDGYQKGYDKVEATTVDLTPAFYNVVEGQVKLVESGDQVTIAPFTYKDNQNKVVYYYGYSVAPSVEEGWRTAKIEKAKLYANNVETYKTSDVKDTVTSTTETVRDDVTLYVTNHNNSGAINTYVYKTLADAQAHSGGFVAWYPAGVMPTTLTGNFTVTPPTDATAKNIPVTLFRDAIGNTATGYTAYDGTNATTATITPVTVNVDVATITKNSAVKPGVKVVAYLPEVKAVTENLGTTVGVNGESTTQNFVNTVAYGHYTGNIDKNWSINLIEEDNGVADLVEKAELYKADEVDYLSYKDHTKEIMPNAVYLKVTLKDSWKLADDADLKYYVYVADNKSGNETNKVWVSGTYAASYQYVDFTWTNDASKAGLWKVKDGENGVAVFDFADKAFFQVKMYSKESMYLDLSTAYDKAIAGDFSEADAFFAFDNENANFSRTGTLILVSDDASLIPYQVTEDGYVKVDAEYVEDFAIAHTNEKVDGFVFETKELGNYVLSTEEVEVEEDDKDDNTQEVVVPDTDNNETNNNSKPNPSTGAEDFVGLAVSLAVVSVAAAGALALKK